MDIGVCKIIQKVWGELGILNLIRSSNFGFLWSRFHYGLITMSMHIVVKVRDCGVHLVFLICFPDTDWFLRYTILIFFARNFLSGLICAW